MAPDCTSLAVKPRVEILSFPIWGEVEKRGSLKMSILLYLVAYLRASPLKNPRNRSNPRLCLLQRITRISPWRRRATMRQIQRIKEWGWGVGEGR